MGREPEELCSGAVTDWGTVLVCEEVFTLHHKDCTLHYENRVFTEFQTER